MYNLDGGWIEGMKSECKVLDALSQNKTRIILNPMGLILEWFKQRMLGFVWGLGFLYRGQSAVLGWDFSN